MNNSWKGPFFRFLQKAGLLLFSLLFILSGAGCNLSPRRAAPGSQETPPFLPPTLQPTPIPATATPVITPTTLSEGKGCTDILAYLSDLTIPDGTEVASGDKLDKQWQVENKGTCNWGEGYELRLMSGSEMGAASTQTLVPARSGTRAVIRIVFTAPVEKGQYKSAWQAYNPEGQSFGDPFFIDITVK